MESFKLSNFQRENPERPFPWFKTLDVNSCASLRGRLAERLGVDTRADPLTLVKTLSEKAKAVGQIDLTVSERDFMAVLRQEKIKSRDLVYINWYRFDQIDQMRLLDLCENLGSIWYPGSDDIEVFDESLNWVISIAHHGTIGVAKL
jgi:hypothetical protein